MLFAAGCGRLAFDPLAGGDGSAGSGNIVDGALNDGPVGSVVRVFGECAEADIRNVTADTFLDSEERDDNFGRRDEMRVELPEENVSLLRFDLSAIPVSATLHSLELLISVSAGDALEDGAVVVTAMLEAWQEGTGDYSTGIANWNDRVPGQAWSQEGAGAPDSRDTTVLGQFEPNVENVRHVVDLQVSPLVAQWIVDPSVNYGFALFAIGETNGQGGWLSTSNEADESRRPCLRVIYTP